MENEARMTFFEHLDELRKRLVITSIAYAICVAVSYPLLYERVLYLLLVPSGASELETLSPLEPFLVRLQISLFTAFVIASPVIFYNLFAFLAPALKKREKRILYGLVFVLVFLFVSGVVLGYLKILPVGITWLMQQGGVQIKTVLRATDYISVVSWFLLSFGIAFETPVIFYTLVKLGILSKDALKSNWRVVYISILLAASILTPDFSPVTMLMLAMPMILLYHATILALKWL